MFVCLFEVFAQIFELFHLSSPPPSHVFAEQPTSSTSRPRKKCAQLDRDGTASEGGELSTDLGRER